MPTVVITKEGMKAINALDASVSPLVTGFLEKLANPDETNGLNIKPLKNAVDRRVRTARVNRNYRAVLFSVDSGGHQVYHVAGVWPHDEGNDRAANIAATISLTFNPALGVAEITHHEREGHSEDDLARAFEEGRAAGLTSAGMNGRLDQSESQERDNPLEAENWTVDTLIHDAGITDRYAEAAMQAVDQAGVSQVAERMPEVQRLMLLELAMGTSLAEAKVHLNLPSQEAVEELRHADPDHQITEGARNAPSAFSVLGDTPEAVQKAYSDLSMQEWQIFLHPEQKRYVEQRGKGSFRLTGGAGTGKTVILVHRARSLYQDNPQAKILLTTYTVALGKALSDQLALLDRDIPQVDKGRSGVTVAGIDQLASTVLASATTEELQAAQAEVFGPGRNEFTRRVAGNKESQLWQDAVSTVAGDALTDGLVQPAFLTQEYLSVVLARRVKSLRDYARVPRTGRGTRLSRAQRSQVWEIIEQFRNANLASDQITFSEVTVLAAVVLEKRAEVANTWLFDHVLVDEAQDFHAGHWQLLRALAPQRENDLFIAEDAHQRIYGQKLTLKQFGIEIQGRSRRLKLNYRTTAQNLAFAMKLLEGQADGGVWEGLEENPEDPAEVTNVEGYTSVLTGPVPKLVPADGTGEEYDAAAEQIRSWTDQDDDTEPGPAERALEDIAVLTRSINQMKAVAEALDARGIPVQAIERNGAPKPGHVQLRTMHSAKGMEFKCVVLIGVGQQHIPARWAMRRLPEAEQRDVYQRERSLLYVAASRAREELMVTYSGAPSSLLPD